MSWQPDAWFRGTTRPTICLLGVSIADRGPAAGSAGAGSAESFEQGDVRRAPRRRRASARAAAAALASSVRRPCRRPARAGGPDRSAESASQPRQLPGVELGRRSSPGVRNRARRCRRRRRAPGRAPPRHGPAAPGRRAPRVRSSSSAHAASAASTSPARQLGIDHTVSNSTARSRSSPIARRPRAAAARARSWSPRARCSRAAGQQGLHRLVLAEQQRLGFGEAGPAGCADRRGRCPDASSAPGIAASKSVLARTRTASASLHRRAPPAASPCTLSQWLDEEHRALRRRTRSARAGASRSAHDAARSKSAAT